VRLVFAEKTTVLGFNSNDSIHSHQITRLTPIWLSEKEPGSIRKAGTQEILATIGTHFCCEQAGNFTRQSDLESA